MDPDVSRPRRPLVTALVVATAVSLLVPILLSWPLVTCLREAQVITPFTGPTSYQIEVQLDQVTGVRPWGTLVDDVGYPYGAVAILVGWLPTVLLAPLRPFLTPPALFSILLLVSPALSALAAAWAVRKATGVDGPAGGLLAATYALCPFALGAFAAGATEKLAIGVFAFFFAAILAAGEAWVAVLLPAIATLGAGYVDPSLMAHFPVVGVAAGGLALARGRSGVTLARLLVAAGLCAPALAPLLAYYGGVHGSLAPDGRMLAFAPLESLGGPQDRPGPLAPIATLATFVEPVAPRPIEPRLYYVTYVGWPVIALALAALVRGGPGRGWSVMMALGGLVLALGPRLAHGDAWVERNGGPVVLPAAALERLVPELATSGSWYRAMGAAWLGIVLLLASGVGRLQARWRITGAAVVFLAVVGGGLHATRFLWPMPVGAIPGRTTLLAWATDPGAGAVMDLPLIEARPRWGAHSGVDAMLAATLHRRPTTALPRTGAANGHPGYLPARSLDAALATGDGAAARASLTAAGYRFLAYRRGAEPLAAELAALTAVLGPPQEDGGLYSWDLLAP